MNFPEATLAALALLSVALTLWQWLAARRFPLHRRVTDLSFTPAITLLKPLKGCDATTAESFQSWFNQDYPGQIQILFGVADAGDPVCPVVRELIEKNPGRDAQLVVCAESLGASGKVSTLIQLERLAKHEMILVSDADVRVPPDFLANIAAPLRDPKAGLVNCFYRLANHATAAMRCEAVAINADFWSQVLQSTSLKPLDFALGAVMLTRRKLLEEIGVDGNGLATHGGRRGICQPVKTIDQAGFGIAQRRGNVGEKIRWHAHIGIANQNQRMFGQPFELNERGDLAVGAERFGADGELRIAAGIFFDEFADDLANRITGVGDAEQNFNRSGVILIEPALERFGGGGVAAFERFEQADGGGKGQIRDAPVQWKSRGGEPLPEHQREAQQRQGGKK